MTNEQAKVGMELDTEMLQLINETNRMSRDASRVARELSWVKEFVREGIQHGTLAEAIYYALRAAVTGRAKTIEEALMEGASEWYK